MHPGWADTMVWLAAEPEVRIPTGSLWLDRRSRPAHRLRRTRRTDTAAERARHWAFCRDRRGITSDEVAALS